MATILLLVASLSHPEYKSTLTYMEMKFVDDWPVKFEDNELVDILLRFFCELFLIFVDFYDYIMYILDIFWQKSS
jgi:hypothetical protein